MAQSIQQHEGRKYLRRIYSAVDPSQSVEIDVYSVLEAFGVTCPGRQQAVKKLLCTGLRGKGDQLADLIGADAALSRAIDLEKGRIANTSAGKVITGFECGEPIYEARPSIPGYRETPDQEILRLRNSMKGCTKPDCEKCTEMKGRIAELEEMKRMEL